MKITKFPKNFTKDDGGLWIQNNLDKIGVGGILEDTHKTEFMPKTFRLFNSYECAQLLRFWSVINVIKTVFDLYQKRVKKRKKRVRVLDLGCSYMKLYQMWVNNGDFFGRPRCTYYGVELDRKSLLTGRDDIKKRRRDRIVPIVADIATPILFDEKRKFDIIVSMETFEHVPKNRVKTLLRNIGRNIAENGMAVITGENPKKGEKSVFKRSNHYYEWRYDEIDKLIKDSKCGLKINRLTSFLARPTYMHHSSMKLKNIRSHLMNFLPTSFVNNICCMLENDMIGKQWIMILCRGKDYEHI